MVRLHWTVDLLQQLASSCYKMRSSQLTYFVYPAAVLCVIGSCLQTIVVAYHEFHTHSKKLHQQVTMARNDRSMQRV